VLLFLSCFLNILLYTLGVIVICGLLMEGCYALCFRLLGRRQGRAFWFATSWLGTPVHELGHAAMCLLFGHKIEKMRLFPDRRGVAMVQHSYNRKNPWATMGNLFIGIGPIFSGLAVILTVLWLVYPLSLQAFYAADGGLGGDAVWLLLDRMWQLLRGLLLETSRPVWARILAAVVLFSVTQHVRLSTTDIRGMGRGVPAYLLLCVIAAAIAAILGPGAASWVLEAAVWFGGTVLMLFGVIFPFALLQLTLLLIYKLLALLFAILFAPPPANKRKKKKKATR